MEPLPLDRAERVKILQRDPMEYTRRMGRSDIEDLLENIARADGLSRGEQQELTELRRRAKYNVNPDYVKGH